MLSHCAIVKTVVSAALFASLGACVSYAPVAIVLPSGQVLRGKSAATASGLFSARNEKVDCSGSFSRSVAGHNISVGRHSSVFAACTNGQNATSNDPLWETGQAKLRFNDGGEGTMLIGEAAEQVQQSEARRKAK
jgi:hypothetical protein